MTYMGYLEKLKGDGENYSCAAKKNDAELSPYEIVDYAIYFCKPLKNSIHYSTSNKKRTAEKCGPQKDIKSP